MKNWLTRAVPAALLATIVAGETPAFAADPLKVVAVNYPLAFFAQSIGGDAVDAQLPAPNDVDPAFWRPTIAEIAEIQRADLIVLNGADYAQWPKKASLPRRALVQASAGMEETFIKTETITHSHGAGGEHSHAGVAAFLWLDPQLAARQADGIAMRLKRAAPDRAATIDANLETLRSELDALDAEAQEVAGRLDGRRFVASHPRYQYFARRYGFDIDALALAPETPPTKDDWAALDALIATGAPAAMIWERPPAPEWLAGLEEREIESVVFDTLARRPADGDFLSMYREGLQSLDALATRL